MSAIAKNLGNIQGAARAHAKILPYGNTEAFAYSKAGQKLIKAGLAVAGKQLAAEAGPGNKFFIRQQKLGDGRIGWNLTGPVDRSIDVQVKGNNLRVAFNDANDDGRK